MQPAASAALEVLYPPPEEKEAVSTSKATPDIRRFLRPTNNAELAAARKMASLSAFAYFISSVTVRGAQPAFCGPEALVRCLLAPSARAEAPRRATRSARWPRATG